MEEVFVYLKGKDPVAYQAARKAMQCFEPFNVREGFSYAERSYGMSSSCRNEVVDLLAKIRTRMPVFDTDFESIFNAEQNALVAVNAERYYHAMLDSGASTWNIRDRHMTETAERLREFLGPDAKLAIWEHNTHIGDARATSMKRSGLVNIGQLLMEKYGPEDVFRVGFGSYGGTVVAAKEWGAEMEKMRVPDAREDSWDWMLHQDGRNKLVFSEDFAGFTQNIGHRAIGVVYDPDFEYGNYVPSVIPERYEAFAFIDRTSALHPMRVRPDGMQMPETYPWGV
jgi:erythromycin esterase-like protein